MSPHLAKSSRRYGTACAPVSPTPIQFSYTGSESNHSKAAQLRRLGGAAALSPRNNTERFEKQLNGGVRQLIDLRAQKSFEQILVECSPLASPVMGGVESRRMHQIHLVKLGVNKGGRF